ncbi:hypothetical protein CPB97_009615 [Podila verticillata]|nr:hypothetical protein CPB97_009615 [Podila verticillata]
MAPSHTYSIDSISSSFTSSTRSSSTRHPSEFSFITTSSPRSSEGDDLTRTGAREPRGKRRPTSPRFNRPASPSQSSTKSTQSLLPGKRGKAAQLGMVAVIFFPPMSIFFIFMLPAILFVSITVLYSVAWYLYWKMAHNVTFSKLPLDPRRIWKLNKVFFGVIVSNIFLIPVGISLVKYRYWARPDALLTDIHYNPRRPDNKMDIHAKWNSESGYTSSVLRPVVVFIHGGSWSSGSRAKYTLLGAKLRKMGYVVMIPDYTLYPKGSVNDMLEDVKTAVQWASRNCRQYGGDPQRLYLMGHSAGAHLCALTVLKDCLVRIPHAILGPSPGAISSSPVLSALLYEASKNRKAQKKQGNSDQEDVLPRLRGMILCAGVYDIGEHYKHESMRGVEQISAMSRTMGNSALTFGMNSPTILAQELLQVSTTIDSRFPESQTRHQLLLRHLKALFPAETLMIHGDIDRTVPAKSSMEFWMELKALQLGSTVKLRVVPGMAHHVPVVALMPTFVRSSPFTEALVSELSQFIDGDHKRRKD